uniref:Uncharacterized protein n=1 Tax=Arundo donax TaxID=35708 RepID=A0A0A8ZSG6_ARUDO
MQIGDSYYNGRIACNQNWC